jgi:peptide/nickel transport system permease protein
MTNPSQSQVAATATPAPAMPRRRSRMGALLRDLRQAPFSVWAGLTVLALYLTAAIFAPWIAPYGEAQVFDTPYAEWTREHLLGTDQVGYDFLSRLIFGARNTIGIALVTTALSFAVGVTLGLISALSKGIVDIFLARLVDIIVSIPGLIFSLMLLSIVGSNVFTLALIIATLDSTNFFRLARTTGMSIVAQDFIEVARLRGDGLLWIVFREILPNIMPPLIAEAGLRFSFVFLTISALSFLGVGIQPPTADWGSMVRDNATLITYGIVTPLLPAAAIGILTISVNFVADWFLHKLSGLKNGH